MLDAIMSSPVRRLCRGGPNFGAVTGGGAAPRLSSANPPGCARKPPARHVLELRWQAFRQNPFVSNPLRPESPPQKFTFCLNRFTSELRSFS